jgi:hypothetical protein
MTWSISGNYLAGRSCAMVCGCAVDAKLQHPQRPPAVTVTGPAAPWPYSPWSRRHPARPLSASS